MNPVLEEILSCQNLPSLPAVALRVIELTSDVNVSLTDLAETIQNDQGLATKILKTVNSSFYGLRKRCATIDKAIVMLGLSPVKSLALGFSLVESIDNPAGTDTFDYVTYWRRGLYSAVSGKLLAEHARLDCGDEVFLGGLLQDLGMIALYRTLGDEYLTVIQATDGDHRKLVGCELEAFDLQHPDIGAMLIERWKLPEELVLPVKYHERPTAAPASCIDNVRCVALGSMIHDILTLDEPSLILRKLYKKAKDWYDINSEDIDTIVEKSGQASHDMAGLFNLDVGPYSDAAQVLDQAAKNSAAIAKTAPAQGSVMSSVQENSALAQSEFDPFTGAVGAIGFNSAILHGYSLASEKNEPLALVQVEIDAYDTLIERFGDGTEIEAAMGVTALLNHTYECHGGVVCRLSPGRFAVVLPNMSRKNASQLAENFLRELAASAPAWITPEKNQPLEIRTTIGIASFEADTKSVITEPARLVVACSRALKAGKSAGGGSLRVFEPRSAAA